MRAKYHGATGEANMDTDPHLAEVLGCLQESSRGALRSWVQDSRNSCIALLCRPSIPQDVVASSNAGSVAQSPAGGRVPAGGNSKLGGWPFVAAGTSWPVDKKGAQMVFI